MNRRSFLKTIFGTVAILMVAPLEILDPQARVDASPLPVQKVAQDHRVQVRRLLAQLERDISLATSHYIMEYNDTRTRESLAYVLSEHMEMMKSKRVLHDFRVVCDETNNPPSVIDENSLVVDVYLKPIRSLDTVIITCKTGPPNVSY